MTDDKQLEIEKARFLKMIAKHEYDVLRTRHHKQLETMDPEKVAEFDAWLRKRSGLEAAETELAALLEELKEQQN